MNVPALAPEKRPAQRMDFIWVEVTGRCNRECEHCYVKSSPTFDKDALTTTEYMNLIVEARALGCRQIQFIGGEPTLNKDLVNFIRLAHWLGYHFIEVYSNGVVMPPKVFEAVQRYGVHMAFSFYSREPGPMDKIMGAEGSHGKVLATIKKMVEYNIPTRIGVIEMPTNEGLAQDCVKFMNELGIKHAGIDKIRPFGRGENAPKKDPCDGLCGACGLNKACITCEGKVTPCIMGRDEQLELGDLKKTSLTDILADQRFVEVRKRIENHVGPRGTHRTSGVPVQPDSGPDNRPRQQYPDGPGVWAWIPGVAPVQQPQPRQLIAAE